MSESIQNALREAERVVKKQKVCAVQTSACLDKLIGELQATQGLLSNPRVDGNAHIADLVKKLKALDAPEQLSTHTKELHTAVSKLGKALDRAFVADICKATREIEFDKVALNQVIAQHLFQEGHFAVGEQFVQEASVPNGDELKAPFNIMHDVLKEIKAHNLQPALAWLAEHRTQLEKSAAPRVAEAFEFKLHRLQFLHILEKLGYKEALRYARAHFDKFKGTQMPEIQRLMGCLCYINRLESSPYADLASPTQWDVVAREFARQCCGILGQATESPLLVTVAAGSVALPTLLKLATVMEGQSQELKACEQLPVEIELGKEFVFHSIFACPVSRDQATHDNPPMMLPCGHVLCKQSILKIAKSMTRSFKCPYCPMDASPSTCRQIFFPDVE